MDLTIKETLIAGFLAVLPSFLKILVMRMAGAHIGRHVSIGFGAVIMADKFSKIRIGDFTTIRNYTYIICKEINIGSNVHIPHHMWVWGSGTFNAGNRCTFGAYNRIDLRRNSIYIGEFVGITGGCILYTHTHVLPYTQGWTNQLQDIKLEDYAVIGLNVVVLPGVTIGRKSVVGAGSVVNRSIPPNSFAGGVPAKVISGSDRLKVKVNSKELNRRTMEMADDLPDFFGYKVLSKKRIGNRYIVTFRRSTLFTKKVWRILVADAARLKSNEIARMAGGGNLILFSTSRVPGKVSRKIPLWFDMKNLTCCNMPSRFAIDIWFFLRNTYMVNCDVENPHSRN
jgi:maltose O-acetyltransferase